MLYNLLIFLFFIALTNANADKQCINGPYEKNLKLKSSFSCSYAFLRFEYIEANNIHNPYEDCKGMINNSCEKNDLVEQIIKIDQVYEKINYPEISRNLSKSIAEQNQNNSFNKNTLPSKKIKKECIESSMRRLPGNKGYVCGYAENESEQDLEPGDQIIQKYYGRASGNTAQCIDSSMVDYMHFSVNKAIECLSNIAPIDTKTVFKIINNETAFNLSVSSRDGRGIGQITTPAAEELTHATKGNGKYVFQSIINNPNPACTPFRHIAQKDLQEGPPLKNRLKNLCAWVNPGDGLARNLIYTLGYYITLRDYYIKKKLAKINPEFAANSKLVNDLTTIAYGREGLNKVKSLLDQYRVNKNSDITKFIQGINNDSLYLNEASNKMKEMYCLDPKETCDPTKLSAEKLEGAECVE